MGRPGGLSSGGGPDGGVGSRRAGAWVVVVAVPYAPPSDLPEPGPANAVNRQGHGDHARPPPILVTHEGSPFAMSAGAANRMLPFVCDTNSGRRRRPSAPSAGNELARGRRRGADHQARSHQKSARGGRDLRPRPRWNTASPDVSARSGKHQIISLRARIRQWGRAGRPSCSHAQAAERFCRSPYSLALRRRRCIAGGRRRSPAFCRRPRVRCRAAGHAESGG